MSRTKLLKAKARRESGAFVPVPVSVLNSDNYRKLSSKAVKLLFDVAAQLKFKYGGPVNNGDLCITAKNMKNRGWTSRDSLYGAKDELIYYGFIQLTRSQRYISQCSLYGLTFFAINHCDNKLDVPETNVASNLWKTTRRKWKGRRGKNNSLYRISASVVPINGTAEQNFTEMGAA